MGVHHGGGHITVAQQFLQSANVGACLQQMRGEAEAQSLTDTGLQTPAYATAFLSARCSRSSTKWWRRSTPEARLVNSVGEGNNQN